MKTLLYILFSILIGSNIDSEKSYVFFGDDVINLSSKKSRLEFKRNKYPFEKINNNDKSVEKRRHKRRRKVRPPRQGK